MNPDKAAQELAEEADQVVALRALQRMLDDTAPKTMRWSILSTLIYVLGGLS